MILKSKTLKKFYQAVFYHTTHPLPHRHLLYEPVQKQSQKHVFHGHLGWT